MNKNQFRIIFNRARGIMMAVAEYAKSHSSGNSIVGLASNPASLCLHAVTNMVAQIVTVRPLIFSLMLALGMVGLIPNTLSVNTAQADIMADPTAPANQRPVILNAANGVPLVNIQTPSAAGVSRNTYSQFDVNQQGVILNNSRTNVQTQLGGYVQGNPYMAAGTARIILNEVNSQSPSLLNGYIEVAGNRAQVVIANPAGISCGGCGFINASRATLTTGTPIISAGDLIGYRVTGGSINFLGTGLDTTQSNYTDIIARAVNVNANLFANNLNIVTGANQINVASMGDLSSIAPIASTTNAPSFALDVAALGGMYAGKIHMIGTDAGLGVRNAGQMGASVGDVSIDVNGVLSNTVTGRIISQQAAQLQASQGINNAGVMYTSGNSTLNTQGNVTNTGTLAASGNLNLVANGANSSINSSAGSVLAAGLNADGTIQSITTALANNTGNLTISATQSIAALGQNLAAKDQAMTAQALTLTGSQSIARELSLTASNGNIAATQATISVNGTLSASTTQSLISDGAKVSAGQLALTAHTLCNVAGELIQTGAGDTLINLAGNLNNSQGRIASNSNNLAISAQTLTNTDGSIVHAGNGTLSINATLLQGTGGNIASNNNLNLSAQTAILDAGSTVAKQIFIDTGILSNRSGNIIQSGTGNSTILASISVDNTGGSLVSNGNTTLGVASLINQAGSIQVGSDSNLLINATGLVDNTAGNISAGGLLNINAIQLINNTGAITATQSLTTSLTQALDNRQGLLAANQDVTVTATAIDNSQGTIASAQANLTATATNGAIVNNVGRLQSAQDIHLSSDGLSNIDGVISGLNVKLNTNAADLNNTRGSIAALGLAGTHGLLNLQSGQLINNAGFIQSAGSMTINTQAQALINTNFGSITSESDISLTGASLDNGGGQIQALGDVTLSLANGTLDNTASLLRAGQTLTITAGTVINDNTLAINQGLAAQNVVITANQLNNTAGAIRADNILTLTSHGIINNNLGQISSGNTLTLADNNLAAKALTISNASGTIFANTALNINSFSLAGDGQILSIGHLNANLSSDYTQTNAGQLQADGNLNLTTNGNITNLSNILAGQNLSLNAANINNTAAGVISGLDTFINATNALTNRGLIDGSNTFITANTVNNIGTGAIFGDHIAIAANTLNNQDELNISAVIAARSRLDLGANYISNLNNSLLFSAGDMFIGGILDTNHQANAQAASLLNQAATIEALGNLSANIADLHNLNGGITTQTVLVGSTAYDQFTPRDTSVILNAADYPLWQIGNQNISWRYGATYNQPFNFREYWRYVYTGTTSQTQVLSTAPAQLLSGSNMTLNGNITNSDSKIIAGGALNIAGASLSNLNSQGQSTTSYSGTAYYYDYDGSGSGFDYAVSASAYNPANSVSTFSLPTSTVAQLTTPSGTGTQIGALNTSSVSQTAVGAGSTNVQINPISSLPVITTVVSTSTVNGASVNSVVATVSPNISYPNNRLFQSSPNPNSSYLIETNPRFASYRTWLSSDYMLAQLSLDPATITKRLGDGFYEQKLIREQIGQLTGQRFLAGYSNEEAQYQALMVNGITFAKAFNITSGIALTELQMAQLTSDIVWLVEQTVTLPDGTITKALVPQVYAKLRDGDLSNTGSLLAGNSVKLNLTGDMTNSGTLGSRTLLALNADNIHNLGGVISGHDGQLNARQDLNNIGGSIAAQNSLTLQAGHDINVVSTTQSSQNATGNSTFSRTNLDRVAGLYVAGGQGLLAVVAGNDINLDAAQIINTASNNNGDATNTNQTMISAGNNINSGTVQVAEQNNSVRNSKNYIKHGSTDDIGTTLQTEGDITLTAGNNLNTRAATITSKTGSLQGVAVGDINISSGEHTDNMATARYVKKSGTFSSKKTTTRDTFNNSNSIGSSLSAEAIDLVAGASLVGTQGPAQTRQNSVRPEFVEGQGNLTIQGSNVVATQDVNLAASGNINIISAQDMHDETHYKKVKQSGLSTSGASVTLGSSKLTTTNDTQTVTQQASTVGSVEGNVNINAGLGGNASNNTGTYNQTASDVLTPAGDINIAAQQVNIAAGQDTYANQQTMKYKQSGLTLAVSSSALNLAQSVAGITQGIIKSDSTGNKMLNPLQTYANTSTLMEQADAIASAVKEGEAQDAADAAGVRVSISVGSSKASSASSTNATTSQESLLKAGGDINIKTSKDNINVVGSNIQAEHNVTLDSAKDISLIASDDTEANLSKNKSSSASIGISFGVGKNTGFSVDLAASRGKGNANSNSTTYNNSQVSAGETLNLKSGNDTNLVGANLSGKQVVASISGDLNIESLQDTATSKAKQSNTSVGVSIPIGPGTGGGNFSQSKQKSSSNYASVYEQSGIKAGEEGFNLNVKNNTDLKGATISSEAGTDRNQLTTGTLTTSNIQNHMDAKASSSTTGLSTDMLSSKYAAVKGLANNLMNNGTTNISDDSTTLSAIAPASIIITDESKQQTLTGKTADEAVAMLSRDTTKTNHVLAKPDLQALQEEVQQQQADKAFLLNTVAALADDGIKKLSNPKLNKVFCTQEPCHNDQQANNKLIGEIALDIFINNPGMSAEDATKLAIDKITGPGGDASLADPEYSGNDSNRLVYKINPLTNEEVRVSNIQTLPTTLDDLATLPNDQKQNSTVFANGIFNNLQRGAELAIQQTPTYDPTDLAQLQRIAETGNVAVGDTYLVHTDKANTFIGELIVAAIGKQAEILGIATPAASLKADAIRILSTNTATGATDNTIFSVGHSRGTMTDSVAAGLLGNLGFYNPNLQFIEDNPAAQQTRLENRISQITTPQNLYIWAPSHDPVATFTGGYGHNYLGSLASVPSVFTTSNSVHSSPGTGAVGSLTADVNKPISYSNINVEQLNETKAQQTQTYLQQLFSLPKAGYTAPQIDKTQQLQQQTQLQNNKQMNRLLHNTGSTSPSVQISNEAYQKLLQLRNIVKEGAK